jgi:hypothetical protein
MPSWLWNLSDGLNPTVRQPSLRHLAGRGTASGDEAGQQVSNRVSASGPGTVEELRECVGSGTRVRADSRMLYHWRNLMPSQAGPGAALIPPCGNFGKRPVARLLNLAAVPAAGFVSEIRMKGVTLHSTSTRRCRTAGRSVNLQRLWRFPARESDPLKLETLNPRPLAEGGF